MFSNRSPWLVTAAVLVSLLGCGRSAPPSKPQVPADPKTESPQVAKRDAKDVGTESSTEAKPSPSIDEDSAAAAILRTLQALEAGDLAKAYDFLPPAYQSDIDGLVHEFASRMDADIWAKLVATTRKSIELLRTKKDRILALDLFERPEAEPYRKHWDSTLDLLNTLVNSEAASLGQTR